MKCWGYRDGAPWLPVRLHGRILVSDWALVDTGARYCILHPYLVPPLGLEGRRSESLYGFGSRSPIPAWVAPLRVEMEDRFETVEFAWMPANRFPEKAPKVILGRNFLERFVVQLDRNRICIGR